MVYHPSGQSTHLSAKWAAAGAHHVAVAVRRRCAISQRQGGQEGGLGTARVQAARVQAARQRPPVGGERGIMNGTWDVNRAVGRQCLSEWTILCAWLRLVGLVLWWAYRIRHCVNRMLFTQGEGIQGPARTLGIEISDVHALWGTI